MSFGCRRDDGSDDVYSPYLKWLWRRRWVKMS